MQFKNTSLTVSLPLNLLHVVKSVLSLKMTNPKLIAYVVKCYVDNCPIKITPYYVACRLENRRQKKQAEMMSTVIQTTGDLRVISTRISLQKINSNLSRKYKSFARNKKLLRANGENYEFEPHLVSGCKTKRIDLYNVFSDGNDINIQLLSAMTNLSPVGITLSLSEQVIYALEFFIYFSMNNLAFTRKIKPIIPYMGNKFPSEMKTMLCTNHLGHENDTILELFGGSSAFTMLLSGKNYIVNELNSNIFNLNLCLKYYHHELVLELLQGNWTRTYFGQLKNHIPRIERTNNGLLIPNVKEAAIYIFRYTCSVWGKLGSFRNNASINTVLKRIDHVFTYHEKFKDAKLLNEDALDILLELLEHPTNDRYGIFEYVNGRSKLIIYADPPYLDTEDYENDHSNIKADIESFSDSIESHSKLILLLEKLGVNYSYHFRSNTQIEKLIASTDNKVFAVQIGIRKGKPIIEKIANNFT